MKKLLLLFVLLISCKSFSQTTYIPNPNFEQALIDLGYDSGPLDQQVYTENINTVTSLSISVTGSLIGIEGFTALTELNLSCYSTSLDLSYNTALTSLNLYSDSLANLDLSQNTSLTSVVLQSTTAIIFNVNISNLTALSYLKIGGNITGVDLSTNTALEKLDIRSNYGSNGTALDLSNNLLLTDLYLLYPVANINFLNNLTFLNRVTIRSELISDITLPVMPNLLFLQITSPLTHLNIFNAANLEHLVIYDSNNISSVDLSQNSNLKNLDFQNCASLTNVDLSQNTLLEGIYFRYVPLTSLDVSHNSNLQFAFLFQVNVTNLNLSNNPALTWLSYTPSIGFTVIPFTFLDLRNGNNHNITDLYLQSSQPNGCVFVDDINGAYMNNTNIWNPNFNYVNNESACVALSLQDTFTTQEVSIFPNPASSKLYLKIPDGLIINRMIVTDISGKKVMELQGISNEIDVESLETGMYIIRFLNGERNMVAKFMKL